MCFSRSAVPDPVTFCLLLGPRTCQSPHALPISPLVCFVTPDPIFLVFIRDHCRPSPLCPPTRVWDLGSPTLPFPALSCHTSHSSASLMMDQVALLRPCYLPMVQQYPMIRMFRQWLSAASLPSFTRDTPCRPYCHIPPIGRYSTKQVAVLKCSAFDFHLLSSHS